MQCKLLIMWMRDATLKNASFNGCVVSVCCVGLESFDVVFDELHECA